MFLLQAIFFSPILMAIISVTVLVYVRSAGIQKSSAALLCGLSLAYASIGLVASFMYSIISMSWYESSSGVSQGNAPLGWIFFYGPLSVAAGQLAALLQWWLKKKLRSVHSREPMQAARNNNGK